MENKKNNQQGFTLMVAMLVSTIVIVVGLGVSSIIFRQFNLAVLSRESQNSFYVADTLVECITYWDLKGKVFAPADISDPDPNSAPNPANLSNLVCDHKELPAEDVVIDIIPDGDGEIPSCYNRRYRNYKTELTLRSVKGANPPVAYAQITRRRSCDVDDLYTVITQIDTNGYNSSRPSDDRRIERGLSLTY